MSRSRGSGSRTDPTRQHRPGHGPTPGTVFVAGAYQSRPRHSAAPPEPHPTPGGSILRSARRTASSGGRPAVGILLAAVGATWAAIPAGLGAQDEADRPGGWNDAEALELVQRARERRSATFADSAMQSYRARASGWVYFFLDRDRDDEQTLIKVDQLALDVFWKAPDRTRQRIVGQRDERVLPTSIRYHLDHLTVVQDEFPDRIRLGDGDEVRDVAHPVSPGSEEVYDFRLASSLTLSYGDGGRAVRVHEIQVRPRDPDRPAFLGSVFLERSSGAIVRMRFTFTPSSYVDPYLDYIRISLDNALWLEEHWLPFRQEVELRREVPELDLLGGSVIRSRFRIADYRFNETIPDGFFQAPRVTAVSRERREAFPFEEPLFAQVEEDGLGQLEGIDEVRETAERIARDRALSGLSPVRLGAASASEIYRYTRTEGHVLGLGLSVRPHPSADLHLRGGWAFGREKPVATAELAEADEGSWRMEGYLNRPVAIGPLPSASGVVNTLGALLFDADWTDPFFVSGGRMALQRRSSPLPGGTRIEAAVRLQRERSPQIVLDDAARFRPAPEIVDGELLAVEFTHDWGGAVDPDEGWGARLRLFQGLDVGSTDFDHTRVLTTVAWSGAHPWNDLDLAARLDAGWVSVDAPPQALFLLGGRGSLLGHPTHGFEGDRFWLLRADVRRSVVEPWLSARIFGAAGQAEGRSADPRLGRDPRAGVRASVGAGVSLLWDVVHLDWGYGLDGGSGEVALSVARRFHGWL